MYRVLGPLVFVWCATGSLCWLLPARAAEPNDAKKSYPLWDGQETIEHYARRVNLPPTRTLDLGGGVTMDFVLIPAGKFIMGTPEPKPVDEDSFRKKIVAGVAVFAVGVGVLLVLIATVIIRAIRKRRRPQYSLAKFIVMMLAASVAVLGGMHWWTSAQDLKQALAEYPAAVERRKDGYRPEERPGHLVTLTRPFYMGKFEVTQRQYLTTIGVNPSRFQNYESPVESVTWHDAIAFCEHLSKQTRQTVRLPTEAEWEFAARAGTVTKRYSGDSEADLARVGWYCANSGNTTHSVGQKEPNAFGLYDVHGNVWEWCQDWADEKYYAASPPVNPSGPAEGSERVSRGGAWHNIPHCCRSSYRAWAVPGETGHNFGFRVVVSLPTPP